MTYLTVSYVVLAFVLVIHADSAINTQTTTYPDYGNITDNDRLAFEVSQHKPCSQGTNKTNELIRFPDDKHSTIRRKAGQPGCYHLEGPVVVFHDIVKDIQTYVEIRRDSNTNEPPEKCKDPQANGCGGSGGSCIHCANCDDEQKYADDIKLTEATLLINKKQRKCGETLKAGKYNNMSLAFCLPTKKEYIDAMGYDDQLWSKILEITASNDGKVAMPIVMKIIMFDFNVASLMASQRKLEPFHEQLMINQNKLEKGHRLPMSVYKTLPFSKYVTSSSNAYAGCHTISGSISLENDSLKK